MKMQRWEPWTNWDEASDMREDNSGSYVLYADAMERERVLREALEKIRILAEASQLCGDRAPAVTAQTLIPLIDAALAQ